MPGIVSPPPAADGSAADRPLKPLPGPLVCIELISHSSSVQPPCAVSVGDVRTQSPPEGMSASSEFWWILMPVGGTCEDAVLVYGFVQRQHDPTRTC